MQFCSGSSQVKSSQFTSQTYWIHINWAFMLTTATVKSHINAWTYSYTYAMIQYFQIHCNRSRLKSINVLENCINLCSFINFSLVFIFIYNCLRPASVIHLLLFYRYCLLWICPALPHIKPKQKKLKLDSIATVLYISKWTELLSSTLNQLCNTHEYTHPYCVRRHSIKLKTKRCYEMSWHGALWTEQKNIIIITA